MKGLFSSHFQWALALDACERTGLRFTPGMGHVHHLPHTFILTHKERSVKYRIISRRSVSWGLYRGSNPFPLQRHFPWPFRSVFSGNFPLKGGLSDQFLQEDHFTSPKRLRLCHEDRRDFPPVSPQRATRKRWRKRHVLCEPCRCSAGGWCDRYTPQPFYTPPGG